MTQADSDPDAAWESLDGMLPELETLYMDIHSHPELSMQEQRTAAIAAGLLRSSGFEVTTGIGGTGVVGVLRNGDGPTVMLRADMDACRWRRQQACRTRAR
jgi:hippurate hydrolase